MALTRRLAAISPSDPDKRRKAMRLFLEATLLREWGDDAVNDPAFQQLVDRLHDEMGEHAQLREQMDIAADQLLRLGR